MYRSRKLSKETPITHLSLSMISTMISMIDDEDREDRGGGDNENEQVVEKDDDDTESEHSNTSQKESEKIAFQAAEKKRVEDDKRRYIAESCTTLNFMYGRDGVAEWKKEIILFDKKLYTYQDLQVLLSVLIE